MIRFKLNRCISRKEANKILTFMMEIIGAFGYATIADLHDLIDYRSVYTDNKYGWRSLKGARVSLIRKDRRYQLILPNPEEV